MIDMRGIAVEDERALDDAEAAFSIEAAQAFGRATGAAAVWDYGAARVHAAVGSLMWSAWREIREARAEWRRLDQWADDGGRA